MDTVLLKDIITNKDSKLNDNLSIILLWKEIVGQQIAKISAPAKIERDTLHILVKNTTWAYELNFHKNNIIGKLYERLKIQINQIRIHPSSYIKPYYRNINKLKKAKKFPPIDKNHPIIEAVTTNIKDKRIKELASIVLWKAINN